ncbi:Clp protease N-terminal domain-containing protein [Streptomyces tardus]|nr:Clp protease N-terminal domain-containing protein [Streptomyces tardus]
MPTAMEPDWGMTGVLGGARGARGNDELIGTQHLLAATASGKGPVRDALADEGVTRTAVFAVLRDGMEVDDAWSGADDLNRSVSGAEILGEHGDERTRFTGAAADALTAAMELARQEDASKFGPAHLLRALLAEENHAAELLSKCGTTPEAVLNRLDGGPGSGDDDLDPLLRPTRDALLNRAQYRRMPFWQRWVSRWGNINWAARPTEWIPWEAQEQAHRRGEEALGTEHVLLAVLATHAVAERHPHLAGEGGSAGDRYAGGARLVDRGLDHAAVHRALEDGSLILPPDPRPAQQYLDEARAADGTSPADAPGTGPLVDALLSEDTRARRLVEHLAATSTEPPV